MSVRGRSALAALWVVIAITACTEVNTAPDAVLSIQFDSLPANAVVIGDTMRGEDLIAAPVRAFAFNAAGDTLPGGVVRLFPLDDSTATAFTYDSARRIVVGVRRISAARVVARAGSVQSQVQTFALVPAPTRITRPDTAARDSIIYNALVPTSRGRDIAVRAEQATGTTLATVDGLRVGFRIVRMPSATRFDSVALLPNSSSTRRSRSTIQAGGSATIHLRVFTKPEATTQRFIDTVIVEAMVRVRADTLRQQVLVRLVPLPATS